MTGNIELNGTLNKQKQELKWNGLRLAAALFRWAATLSMQFIHNIPPGHTQRGPPEHTLFFYLGFDLMIET